MATCEVCGNDYDKAMEITRDGESHVFDSFECAIHALAPACDHCGCKVIGHGVEAGGGFFFWAAWASHAGAEGAGHRVSEPPGPPAAGRRLRVDDLGQRHLVERRGPVAEAGAARALRLG